MTVPTIYNAAPRAVGVGVRADEVEVTDLLTIPYHYGVVVLRTLFPRFGLVRLRLVEDIDGTFAGEFSLPVDKPVLVRRLRQRVLF